MYVIKRVDGKYWHGGRCIWVDGLINAHRYTSLEAAQNVTTALRAQGEWCLETEVPFSLGHL